MSPWLCLTSVSVSWLADLTVATMSSVGFGLSPASGRAIADLVTTGACSFADISKLGLDRFANLPPGWRTARGWQAPALATA